MSDETTELKIQMLTKLAQEAVDNSRRQADAQHATELRLVGLVGELRAVATRLEDGAKKFAELEADDKARDREVERLKMFQTQMQTAIGLVPWLTRGCYALLGAVGMGGVALTALLLTGHLPK